MSRRTQFADWCSQRGGGGPFPKFRLLASLRDSGLAPRTPTAKNSGGVSKHTRFQSEPKFTAAKRGNFGSTSKFAESTNKRRRRRTVLCFVIVKRAFVADLTTTKLQLQKFCTSASNSTSSAELRQFLTHTNS